MSDSRQTGSRAPAGLDVDLEMDWSYKTRQTKSENLAGLILELQINSLKKKSGWID